MESLTKEKKGLEMKTEADVAKMRAELQTLPSLSKMGKCFRKQGIESRITAITEKIFDTVRGEHPMSLLSLLREANEYDLQLCFVAKEG